MSTKHTPEPWRVYSVRNSFISGIDGANESVFIFLTESEYKQQGFDLSPEKMNANISRIVACVNACAGMEDPAAEITALRERIAELEAKVPSKPQPNWDEAPKWAQWWAVDKDGFAFWYESKPVALIDQWDDNSLRLLLICDQLCLNGYDWRETLTQRP